ncbi:hypothetical protein ACFX1X_014681 [Malus domestica]
MPKQQSGLEFGHKVGHVIDLNCLNGCYVQPTRETLQLLVNTLLDIFVRSDIKKLRTILFSGFNMILIISNISKTRQCSYGTWRI